MRVLATSTGASASVPMVAESFCTTGATAFDPSGFGEGFDTVGGALGCSLVQISATSDSTQVSRILPSLGARDFQAGWRVYVNGELVRNLVPGSVQVSRSLGRLTQVAGFTTMHPSGVSPLGNVSATGAPATGLDAIDVRIAFRDGAGGEFELPLITNGVADDTEREVLDGVGDSISLQDALERHINERVTYLLPAGARRRLDGVVRSIASGVGMSVANLPVIPRTLEKELHVRDEPPWSKLRSAAQVVGGALLVDPSGSLDCVFDNPEAPAPQRPRVKWTLTAADILRGEGDQELPILVRPATEAYTSVKATGSRQVLRDACAVETRQFESTSTSDQQYPAGEFTQDGSGNLSSSGVAPVTFAGPVYRSKTRIGDLCGNVVSQWVDEYAVYNPLAYRSTVNTSGVRTYVNGQLADPDGNGVSSPTPSLMLVRRTFLRRNFDADGYLQFEQEQVFAYYSPRHHVAEDTGSGFGNPGGSYFSFNESDGRATGREVLALVSRTTTRYHRDGGFLARQVVTEEGYGARPGSTYLYDDGLESRDSQEAFLKLREIDERWQQAGEDRTIYSVNEWSLRGGTSGTTSTQSQGPPSVERLEVRDPDRANFETDDDFEAAVAASRYENAPIEAECSAPSLLSVRPPNELEARFEEAQSVEELQALCDRLILRGVSPEVEFSMLANPLMREGDRINPPSIRGLPSSGRAWTVQSISHSGECPIISRVVCVAYPEAA